MYYSVTNLLKTGIPEPKNIQNVQHETHVITGGVLSLRIWGVVTWSLSIKVLGGSSQDLYSKYFRCHKKAGHFGTCPINHPKRGPTTSPTDHHGTPRGVPNVSRGARPWDPIPGAPERTDISFGSVRSLRSILQVLSGTSSHRFIQRSRVFGGSGMEKIRTSEIHII